MSERDIYLLSPRALSPETIAVAFAKTSRAPESFREIASELSDEQSAKFHEKWVVGYGHASVAEHAVLHIAFENVSRVAMCASCSPPMRIHSNRSKALSYRRPNAARMNRRKGMIDASAHNMWIAAASFCLLLQTQM
jgi:hypothetical protein